MKKAVMTGLAALRGTFAGVARYLKRWFPVREICLLHSIIVLAIPALFIGCGPPAGALFDDSLKSQLPSEVEIVVKEAEEDILEKGLLFYYDVNRDGYTNTDFDSPDVEYIYMDFYALYNMLLDHSQPGDTIRLSEGSVGGLHTTQCEGSLEQVIRFLQLYWGHYQFLWQNLMGITLVLEIIP
jgi:hypothetical protein